MAGVEAVACGKAWISMSDAARTGSATHEVTASDALKNLLQFDAVIDVRSPSEFADDHIPGAVNCPVLDDAERARIGTLHKQASAFEAKKHGAALVARHIAEHIEQRFLDRPKDWRPLIYCWRGGKRSGAMTTVFRAIGWRATQLEGGYKAFRRYVMNELETLPAQFSYVAVCGATGSGKSRLLEALRLEGRQVLDLEQLAAHKGSVLGDLPDAPQPTQKAFETSVWRELSALDHARSVYVEAESRKIGQLRVPEVLMEHMRQAPCVRVETPIDLRVALLGEEYPHLTHDSTALNAKLDCLKGLHANETLDEWKTVATRGDWRQVVRVLLECHYDPAYKRSMNTNYVNALGAAPIAITDISLQGLRRVAATLP